MRFQSTGRPEPGEWSSPRLNNRFCGLRRFCASRGFFLPPPPPTRLALFAPFSGRNTRPTPRRREPLRLGSIAAETGLTSPVVGLWTRPSAIGWIGFVRCLMEVVCVVTSPDSIAGYAITVRWLRSRRNAAISSGEASGASPCSPRPAAGGLGSIARFSRRIEAGRLGSIAHFRGSSRRVDWVRSLCFWTLSMRLIDVRIEKEPRRAREPSSMNVLQVRSLL